MRIHQGLIQNKCENLEEMLLRVPTVRESQRILRESGKVRENGEGQGKVREF